MLISLQSSRGSFLVGVLLGWVFLGPLNSAPDASTDSGSAPMASSEEPAPRWRMNSAPERGPAPAAGSSWRMSTGSSGVASSGSEAHSAPAAPAFSPIFTSGGDFPAPQPRSRVVSGVVPSHGEGEFGRLPDLGPVDAVSGDEGFRVGAEPGSDALGEGGSQGAAAETSEPRVLWLDGFFDSLVPTQSRRSRRGGPDANAWSYPESGVYHSGVAIDEYDSEPSRGETLVLSDGAPNARVYARSGRQGAYGQEDDAWFRVGQTEAARQDPWGANYRTGHISRGSRYVMPESSHRGYPTRRVGWYDSGYSYIRERGTPLGDYGYDFEVDDSFLQEEQTRFTVRGGFTPFERGFQPDYAHLKAGSFYLQGLWLETGALYSDYRGPIVFRPGEEDGWLGYTSLALRGAARINKDLFFVLDGEVIYLPGTNQVGFRTLGHLPGPSALARLDYLAQIGEWDLHIYDFVGTDYFFDLAYLTREEAYDRAGRYDYGFLDGRSDRTWYLYDPSLFNEVGARASRPVADDWRFAIHGAHTDYFYFDDSRGRRHYDVVGASFSAIPGRIPFSPYIAYTARSMDHFDSATHRVYAGGSGGLTERIDFDGLVGHLWGSGDGIHSSDGNRWLWQMRFRHRISQRSWHSLMFGENYFFRDFSGDSSVSEFARYGIYRRLSNRMVFGGFAQWSRDEFLTGTLAGEGYNREVYGVNLEYHLTDDVWTEVGYYFQKNRNRIVDEEFGRRIAYASTSLRLTERSVCFFRYQYEEGDGDRGSFDEHLWTTGVRRYF